MNYFDNKAKDWDDNPLFVDRAKAIAKEIINSIELTKNMNVLDYGAGTGLLSFCLYDFVKKITLADNSMEMLKIANEKINYNKIKNISTMSINLETENFQEKYDLIYSLMTLHHIKNIDMIVKKFHSNLNNNGYLCIIDLVKEDGSFHTDYKNYDGHNGFIIENLINTLEINKFSEIKHKICYEIEKKFDNNIIKKYPLFMLIGKK
ncbi:MAG: hypothetical protein A2086_13920 [Spirochaetes bacterium GWD1_27_9]|nr:MAG: hypothetical protein A2Z98_14355 [Spirochaetes bacterium GWB1_27_13]OHD22278.1 MAG: hypothetical protein A2Y34_06130 [Spirochaetes bacterium GWC1_27_15]OHD44094.1 MAG: hypothetical protein A2086_13920 [Spirochaetes bacterium GWD1_27_9]